MDTVIQSTLSAKKNTTEKWGLFRMSRALVQTYLTEMLWEQMEKHIFLFVKDAIKHKY